MNNFILFTLIIPLLTLGQNNKQDLYILFDDCTIQKDVNAFNDTLHVETYSLKLGAKKSTVVEYTIDDSGAVATHIQTSGKAHPSLSFTYNNQDNDNPPIRINPKKIKNKIWAKHIVSSKATDYSTFFDNFKNIYLIDFNDPTTTVKTAKKVKVIYKSAL